MSIRDFGSITAWNRESRQEASVDLYRLRDFYVGRNEGCKLSVALPTLSNHHLRIYVVEYDEHAGIAPLAYAENLSQYGTRLKRTDYADLAVPSPEQRLQKGDSAILLSHGDILHLGTSLVLQYDAPGPQKVSMAQLCPAQVAERKAFSHLYKISRRKLGSGAHGHVFMAFDQILKTQLACKIIDLSSTGGKTRKPSSVECQPIEYRSLGKLIPDSVESAVTDLDDHATSTLKWTSSRKRSSRKQYTSDYLLKIKREFEILKDVRHPNVIGLERVFISDSTMHGLFIDSLITGGDLFSYIAYHADRPQDKELKEASAAVVVLQIVTAVAYLHKEGIVHRDLKLDNILMSSLSHGARVILTDFGAAIKVANPGPEEKFRKHRPVRLTSVVGTEDYFAPELYDCLSGKRGYTKAIDLWAIGIITGILLSGYQLYQILDTPAPHPQSSSATTTTTEPASPTSGPRRTKDQYRSMYKDLKAGIPEIDEWSDVSANAKDFVRSLLRLDASERMTADNALKHPWLDNKTYGKTLKEVHTKAIEGWKPGSTGAGLIQHLNVPAASKPRKKQKRELVPEVPVFESRGLPVGDVDTDPRKRRVTVTGGTPMKENVGVGRGREVVWGSGGSSE